MYVMLSYVTYDRNLVIRICRYNYIYVVLLHIYIDLIPIR